MALQGPGTSSGPAAGGSHEPGPAIVVCTGQRCGALLTMRDSGDELGRLRAAVRGTQHAVLIGANCLGRCELGARVLLGWSGGTAWWPLSGMDAPTRLAALVRWLEGTGPVRTLRDGQPLPALLREAMAESYPPQR